MPGVVRQVADGAEPRTGRMHLWQGGHDRDTVRQALRVDLDVSESPATIVLTNIGADRYPGSASLG